MSLWIALALAGQPALSPSSWVGDPTRQGRASAQATVRIVRPYRLRVGEAKPVPGASRRETRIRDADGQHRQAILVEFE